MDAIFGSQISYVDSFCCKRQKPRWFYRPYFSAVESIALRHFCTPAAMPSGSLKIADERIITSGLQAITGSMLFQRNPPSTASSQAGFFSSISRRARWIRLSFLFRQRVLFSAVCREVCLLYPLRYLCRRAKLLPIPPDRLRRRTI